MLGEKTFSSDIYIKKHEMKNGLPVYLNIYHLSRINYMLQVFGVGLFHTTLEVGNIEFSYGRTDDENSGIYYYSLDEDIPNLILKGKHIIEL